MVKVYVASRNPIKLEECLQVFPDAVPFDIELTEIQSPDPEVVVRHKLDQVVGAGLDAPVLVEDTGLAVLHWERLPGALIKWFVEEFSLDRLSEVLRAEGPDSAVATSAVGVAFRGETRVWCGRTEGRIVPARGDLGGWTPIFEVAGTGRTLGEMSFEERMRHTMRAEPLRLAQAWLDTVGH
ncbi:non-canonical purine NTP pyrophosphatase [Streptomyces sp. 150FB]|uniref:non-canonical purine NTP pyrophosphatase n=1 Tax=Streptomyces sp. 150FB TaxID=1576605 RepID=UPI000AFFFEE6|nr:non-canonical purine NTP pyrophosphatase [Streptomyces sp. 150FB]